MRFNTKRGQDIREYYITLEEIFYSYLISDGSPDFYQNDKIKNMIFICYAKNVLADNYLIYISR
jgi:hypothetical protein